MNARFLALAIKQHPVDEYFTVYYNIALFHVQSVYNSAKMVQQSIDIFDISYSKTYICVSWIVFLYV